MEGSAETTPHLHLACNGLKGLGIPDRIQAGKGAVEAALDKLFASS